MSPSRCVLSVYQLGAVVSQDRKPIAFHSRKLNPAQMRHTTTEKELLSIVETLKECQNMLLGQEIEVFTDHKNLVYKHFNTERVMQWRLLLEEFRPKLTHVKGSNNIVADALSRLDIAEEEFSAEAYTGELADEEEEFPTGYPLFYKEIAFCQKNCKKSSGRNQIKKPHTFLDSTHELITKNDTIYVPKALQWSHLTLTHHGEKILELTIAQHYAWIGLCTTCINVCKRCENCAASKK